jgi:hypothetical protein
MHGVTKEVPKIFERKAGAKRQKFYVEFYPFLAFLANLTVYTHD